uniref:Uncharacterized protein n=2 Tax=Oryza sativa subsp. japonica TaxID=39947 RepID=Q7G6W9_ORYSJ|nr:Hypothetical protein [Oryza sativa Japonica Group]AAN60478.1 Hypothetical protein [Oryza sativa Japonica Group]ABF93519.1 hypothetical protein LOC_Os03g01430 [Oryza sativa Japonica Group]ABF93523.1 hypothetical protein LOC_Os03g01480 [Oryza sativa Japonica Group]
MTGGNDDLDHGGGNNDDLDHHSDDVALGSAVTDWVALRRMKFHAPDESGSLTSHDPSIRCLLEILHLVLLALYTCVVLLLATGWHERYRVSYNLFRLLKGK